MTTQTTELTKVKARIKALMERTVDRGCSEQEAMVAAGMVGKLLAQYNLSMSEVDIREERCVTRTAESRNANRDEMWYVAFEIGRFCSCKTWFDSPRYGRSVSTYSYFGHEADADLAVYLFQVVSAAVTTEWTRFKLTSTYLDASVKRTASDSFKRAMCRRVGRRLDEMRVATEEALREREQEQRNAAREQAAATFDRENAERYAAVKTVQEKLARGIAGDEADFALTGQFQAERMAAAEKALGGCSLVVLKGQLVEQEWQDLGMKITNVKTKIRSRDDNAIAAGSRAGDRVNLNRPLARGGSVSALLG